MSVSSEQPFISRHLKSLVEEALDDFRVVIINGPRQAGKTTLLRQLHAARGGSFRTLDRADVLQAAKADPLGFVADAVRPAFIDEIQRGGDALVRAIKIAVDEEPVPGSFVLSGSSRFLTVPTLSESLAGRALLTELWPLSMAERVGAPPQFVDLLFDEPAALRRLPESTLTRTDYLHLVCAGGFPELLRARSPRARSNWLRSYVTTVTQRDISELSRIRFADELPRLLRVVAARTAQVTHAAEIAKTLGMDAATVRNYLPLLQMVYLIHWLPAWSNNLTARAVRAPKVHMVDSGLAAQLMQRGPKSLAEPGTAEAGALFETFVVNELIKQLAVSDAEASAFHYRDRDGAEVDCVLESGDGRIAGLEVKLALSVNEADLRHLRMLRDKLGSRFVAGVLLYSGSQALSFGDRLMALPASALWASRPLPS
jgi:predicted AAA+ superfamily ATPase